MKGTFMLIWWRERTKFKVTRLCIQNGFPLTSFSLPSGPLLWVTLSAFLQFPEVLSAMITACSPVFCNLEPCPITFHWYIRHETCSTAVLDLATEIQPTLHSPSSWSEIWVNCMCQSPKLGKDKKHPHCLFSCYLSLEHWNLQTLHFVIETTGASLCISITAPVQISQCLGQTHG